MKRAVIDASVAIKWVIEETGTAAALSLLDGPQLVAPDLLMPECANILWKKVVRGEFTPDEGALAAELLQRAIVELIPTRGLMAEALRLAVTPPGTPTPRPWFGPIVTATARSESGRRCYREVARRRAGLMPRLSWR